MRNRLDSHDVPVTSALRGVAPKRGGMLPLLLLIAGIFAVKFLFFSGKEQPPSEPETEQGYVVAYDPDLARLEKAAELARATAEPEKPKGPKDLPPPEPGKFRVAAAQFYSRFNRKNVNRYRMAGFVEQAARLHTQVLVFPEAALNGYCDLTDWNFWARDPEKANAAPAQESCFYFDIGKTAETADGESVNIFRKLAAKHQMYIAFPFIERDPQDNSYYNSVSLLAPDGTTALHVRKSRLPEGIDTYWASEGEQKPPFSIATPYGRMGVIIGCDTLAALPKLEAEKAEIILHCAAFTAINMDKWLNGKYRELLKKAGCAAVLANWTPPYTPYWDGYGLSRIINRENEKVAALGTEAEERLVIGDLDIVSPDKGK